jgi:hypothetical protein
VTAPCCPHRIERLDRLDIGVVAGRRHDPTIPASMPRRSAAGGLRFGLCPMGKRFTARPLRCERPW